MGGYVDVNGTGCGTTVLAGIIDESGIKLGGRVGGGIIAKWWFVG